MYTLEVETAAESVQQLTHLLVAEGDSVSPRRLKTYELPDVTIWLQDPADCTMYGIGREAYHPAIGITEGLLMIAGLSDPELLAGIAPVFRRFQDGGALHGAYGPRLRNQLPMVIERLRADPDTRQAVATIWDPLQDLCPPGQAPMDLPCTVYLLFRIRDGRLSMKTHMRSNDVWRGWCYDVLQFTQLQCTVANVLDVPVGPYVHHADSLHVYEHDLEALCKVSRPGLLPGLHLRPQLTGLQATTWPEARTRAQELLYAPEVTAMDRTEAFMLEKLRSATKKEGTSS